MEQAIDRFLVAREQWKCRKEVDSVTEYCAANEFLLAAFANEWVGNAPDILNAFIQFRSNVCEVQHSHRCSPAQARARYEE
jgi:hypothetical protein